MTISSCSCPRQANHHHFGRFVGAGDLVGIMVGGYGQAGLHLDQRAQLGDGAHVEVHILHFLGAETAQHQQVAADPVQQVVGGVNLGLAGAAPQQDGKQLGIAQLVQVGKHAFGGLHGLGQWGGATVVVAGVVSGVVTGGWGRAGHCSLPFGLLMMTLKNAAGVRSRANSGFSIAASARVEDLAGHEGHLLACRNFDDLADHL